MKRLLIFLATAALATGLYLLDHSRLRADEGDPDDPDNVELADPPTSPDAQKEFDGIAIINYEPGNEDGAAVTSEATDGKTDKLPGLQPDQQVEVTMSLGANRAGRTFHVSALEGGQVFDADDGLVADENGNIAFTFQAGHEPGLYQVALHDGTHEIGIQFWVINNENPEENQIVDVPGDGSGGTVTGGPIETPFRNDNPTGPCGRFGPIVATGCSYDPYTTNATRSITDLVVPGAVGMYPLTFTRILNSRYVAGLTGELGSGGNWRHSYQWSIDSSETLDSYGFPTSYWVNYPDGRRVQFGPAPSPSPSPVDPYFRGPRGVSDRFQQLKSGAGFSITDCFLKLPDGGKIHFTATWNGAHFDYQLSEIIDPYGQKQIISYPADRSMTIEEPAHRQLKIFYTRGPIALTNEVVISRVEWWSASPENGGVRVQTVYYGYSLYSIFGNAHAELTSVTYPDTTVGSYTYQNSNLSSESTRPLIRTCVDPMFAGPMWKIAYAFATSSPALSPFMVSCGAKTTSTAPMLAQRYPALRLQAPIPAWKPGGMGRAVRSPIGEVHHRIRRTRSSSRPISKE